MNIFPWALLELVVPAPVFFTYITRGINNKDNVVCASSHSASHHYVGATYRKQTEAVVLM